MDRVNIRIKCLELAMAGDSRSALDRAEQFFAWIVSGEDGGVGGQKDRPKRGRPRKVSEETAPS